MGLPDGGGVGIATAVDVNLNPQSPEFFDGEKNEKVTNGGDCGDQNTEQTDLDDCDNGDGGSDEVEKREIDVEEKEEKEEALDDGEGLRSNGNGGTLIPKI